MPEGTSLNRTRQVAIQIEKAITSLPGIRYVSTVTGFSELSALAQANSAFFIVTLKPFEERTEAAAKVQGLLAGVIRETSDVPAQVIPFNLPPIIGLGTAGGFEYQLQNLEGRPATEMAQVMRALFPAEPASRLQRVFSTYAANTPSVYLNIDRDKAQVLGVPIDEIFSALQASLGSAYVNDFNLFGRTWQVNIQAEASDRAKIDDIYRVHVRTPKV